MKKFIPIFIMFVLVQTCCLAQNNLIPEFNIAEKKFITWNSLPAPVSVNPYLLSVVFTELPSYNPVLTFNDQPVLVPLKYAKKAIRVFTELSFSDLLENSLNRLKAGLVNTYDGDIAELFKEAPSLVRVKCFIPF